MAPAERGGRRGGAQGRRGSGATGGSAGQGRTGGDGRGGRRRPEEPDPRTRQWGSVARRGARVVGETGGRGATVSKRAEAPPRAAGDGPRPWRPEEWIEDAEGAPPASKAAPGRPAPGGAPPRRVGSTPSEVVAELREAVGPAKAARYEQRLTEAVRAYQRDRYADARRILKPLAAAAPGAAAVRELYGLTLYRMGRWAEAIRELDAFHTLTGSFDQHPVLADCHRALGHWRAVERLWDELRRASPAADVVTEGRIVAAGALADQGDLRAALRLLARAPQSRVKRPRLHHLRLWYAMADLYERAGEVPRARELFQVILRHEPDFVDVPERLAALG